jgi:DNA-binding XRE family transcriptional regulator
MSGEDIALGLRPGATVEILYSDATGGHVVARFVGVEGAEPTPGKLARVGHLPVPPGVYEGAVLRWLRLSHGLTQSEVCEVAGLPMATYSTIERGGARLSDEKFAEILAVYGQTD